ncbi:MAG: hypothetical protein HFH88_15535 [Lachnospiraceae bacterium]|nr:hypothetical protein [Lachnospiraceae bacterium]
MSEWIISSTVLIIFVLIIRYLFRNRFAMRVRYALWLVVALRLLVPVSFLESSFSVMNLVDMEKAEGSFAALLSPEETDTSVEVKSAGGEVQRKESNEPGTGTSVMAQKGEEQTRGMESNGSGAMFREKEEAGMGMGRGKGILTGIWLAGVILSAVTVLTVNTAYRRRVYRSRRKCRTELVSALPVYTSSVVSTPCMFGLIHAAIYLPPRAMEEKKKLKYILCHENTHYRHLDQLWVLVRAVCVCIHWYNPLVWLAAGLARQDCELACDEKTLEVLGEEERINYGRTLLDFSAQGDVFFGEFQLSTAMSGRKKQVKERLMLVIEQPRRYAGTLAITAILAIMISTITFTGKVSGQEQDTDSSADSGMEDRDGETSFEQEDGQKETEHTDKNVETAALVPIDLNDGKEYLLKVGGEVIPEEGYRINRITLNQVHDREEDTLQTILLEEVRCLYTRMADEAESGNGFMWSYAFGEEPLYAKKLYTVEDLPSYTVGQTETKGQVLSHVSDGGILVADLNFDGYQDFCLQGAQEGNQSRNVPYYCYLWNQEESRFEPAYMIPNVGVDGKEKLLVSTTDDGNGIISTKYYRFDDTNCLHMVRYVEENQASDAVFPTLDLTYVETAYTLPAVDEWDNGTVYGGALTERFVQGAKQALTELYEWSGTKIDTVCFSTSAYGDFMFGQKPEDIRASRTFYSRVYGSSAGFEECIESMNLATDRTVWYSPVTQRKVPEQMDEMSDEQLAEWYFGRSALAEGEAAASVRQMTQGEYIVETESGHYYAIYLQPATREMDYIAGPYDGYPNH